MEAVTDFIFSGSKITDDGNFSHENERCLLLGRKAMANLSSVQLSLSHVQLFATPWTAARQASLSISQKLAQTHVHQVGDAIQPSHPLLSSSPPAFNLSQQYDIFP